MAKTDVVKIIDQRHPAEYVTYTGLVPSAPASSEIKHNHVQNRALPDQHPITAITNLREELDERVLGAPNGTPARFALWNAPDRITDSVMTQKEDRVGIGVEDPAYKMDVAGLARLFGLIFGLESDGPYMTETNGDLNLSNPEYRTNVGARVLHLEGLEEIAITAWQRSISIELTDRNAADTFSMSLVILPDGYYFIRNGDLLAVLDANGKLWLKDTAIGPLSSFQSAYLDNYFTGLADDE